jgi:hypothetical protein
MEEAGERSFRRDEANMVYSGSNKVGGRTGLI